MRNTWQSKRQMTNDSQHEVSIKRISKRNIQQKDQYVDQGHWRTEFNSAFIVQYCMGAMQQIDAE